MLLSIIWEASGDFFEKEQYFFIIFVFVVFLGYSTVYFIGVILLSVA
jgi:hypothetical protein